MGGCGGAGASRREGFAAALPVPLAVPVSHHAAEGSAHPRGGGRSSWRKRFWGVCVKGSPHVHAPPRPFQAGCSARATVRAAGGGSAFAHACASRTMSPGVPERVAGGGSQPRAMGPGTPAAAWAAVLVFAPRFQGTKRPGTALPCLTPPSAGEAAGCGLPRGTAAAPLLARGANPAGKLWLAPAKSPNPGSPHAPSPASTLTGCFRMAKKSHQGCEKPWEKLGRESTALCLPPPCTQPRQDPQDQAFPFHRMLSSPKSHFSPAREADPQTMGTRPQMKGTRPGSLLGSQQGAALQNPGGWQHPGNSSPIPPSAPFSSYIHRGQGGTSVKK